MKTKIKLIQFSLLGAILLAALGGGAQTAAKFVTAPVSPATNTYLVALRPQADQDRCAKDFSIQRHHSYRHALNGFSAVMDAATAEKLKHDPRVLAMGPDSSFTICQAVEPSHIIRMGLTNFPVWQHNPINVNIAIMDTGIQTNHPDLNVVNWTSVVGGDGSDWEGHGTMVAGLAGALGALVDNVNNAIVVGVAPGAKLWSVQIAIPGGPTGASGSWADFLAGLDYIATNADQIEVINASIAGLAGDTGTYDVVDLAESKICSMGIVFVCAAGNNGSDILGLGGTNRSPDDFLPAALPSAMTVSAMDAHPSDTGAVAY